MTIVSGPGQKAAASFWHARHLGDDAVQHLHAADMHNERVILRAALRFKNFLDGLAVAGVGGNAVDRLRRQGDQLTLLQKPGASATLSGVMGKTCVFIALFSFFCTALLQFFFRSAKISGSTTRSRSPSSTPCKLRSVRPMR